MADRDYLTNNNFKQLNEMALLQFSSDIAVLKVEYHGCTVAIAETEKDLAENSNKDYMVKGLTNYLNSLKAEKDGYEKLFEIYKAKYLELLRDVSGTIENSSLEYWAKQLDK